LQNSSFHTQSRIPIDLSHERKAELVVKALRRAPFRRDGPLKTWPWPALDADQTSELA
jgi:hypothetical protein